MVIRFLLSSSKWPIEVSNKINSDSFINVFLSFFWQNVRISWFKQITSCQKITLSAKIFYIFCCVSFIQQIWYHRKTCLERKEARWICQIHVKEICEGIWCPTTFLMKADKIFCKILNVCVRGLLMLLFSFVMSVARQRCSQNWALWFSDKKCTQMQSKIENDKIERRRWWWWLKWISSKGHLAKIFEGKSM